MRGGRRRRRGRIKEVGGLGSGMLIPPK